MGFSKNPDLRRIQAKNRVQFFKGASFIATGVVLVILFVESLPQSRYSKSCHNPDSLHLRTKRQTSPIDAQTNCASGFREKYINDTAELREECKATLNDDYGKEWRNAEGYDCVYWCDSTEYPKSMFTIRERKYGYVGLYMLGLLYMFLALAIVCDEYFVPALEQVSDKLNLSDDVAGATFMAAGGSAPELFTSLIGAFTNSNVGIGTIVGSAVFNILFVLGACAFIVGFKEDPKTGKGTILSLTWFPLSRDCFFYVLSLVILMLGFSGDIVTWYEALIMISVYVAYVTFMMFNTQIETWALNTFGGKKTAEDIEEATELTETKQAPKTKALWQTAASKAASKATGKKVDFSTRMHLTMTTNFKGNSDDMLAAYAIARLQSYRRAGSRKQRNVGEDGQIEVIEDKSADSKPPSLTGSPYSIQLPFMSYKNEAGETEKPSLMSSIWTLVTLPLTICMKFTIPDVRFKSVQELKMCGCALGEYIFIFSFFMSIVWISAFSWLMVWWATRVGETWNIDPALMGLTILAAGTSVPDLLTSVIVARQGHGDMAVSSSIGSNLFDVTIGLPLPWILYIIYSGSPKAVSSEGIFCSIGLLLTMLVVLVGTIIACGWKMNRIMGAAMLLLYVIFVIISLLLEYKILICPF